MNAGPHAVQNCTPTVSAPARPAILAYLLGMLGIGLWQGPLLSLSLAAIKSLF